MDKIAIFSFIFLLDRNNNKIPNPLPVSKPENNTPREIKWDKYNSVIITLLKQFGISPMKLDKK